VRRSDFLLAASVVLALAGQACEPAATVRPVVTTPVPSIASPSASPVDHGASASGSARPSAPAPHATRTPEGSAGPGVGSAAEQYLRYATASNKAMDELDAKYSRDFASFGEAALYFRAYADITRAFADHVLSIDFPPSVADDAREFVRRLNEEVNAAMRASQASSWDELMTAEDDLSRVSDFSTESAGRLREALGLPPVPTDAP
jgi:hypothetical protein